MSRLGAFGSSRLLLGLALALFFWSATPALACTGIVIQAEDGAVVYARTMEFGADLVSFNLLAVGPARACQGMTPDGQPGLAWRVKYAHVGFNPFGLPLVAEGLNDQGLACGAFFLPGYAKYQDFTPQERDRTISNLDLVSWVLGNFASVQELRAALPGVRVAGVALPQWGTVPPLRYLAVDQSGASLVIEYLDGQLVMRDDFVGVITNSPPYEWHVTNLRNYLGLSAINRPPVKLGAQDIAQLGQGSGSLGLPGDFTPPSRFVRAAFLSHAAYRGQNAEEAVLSAFRILNQFDIPKGALRAQEGGRVIADSTQWTGASDLKNRRLYFHTEYSRRVRMVDLDRLRLDGGAMLTMDVTSPERIEDVSGELK
ncbi:MAG: choloylglycine hydrolase family protein [Desulfarculus sp.]|nr:choloylglycine hydrolase family protein [Desulfarculus sp.]